MEPFIKNIEVLRMNERRPDWQSGNIMGEIYKESECCDSSSFSVVQKYRLTANINVVFFANDAELNTAIVKAKQVLADVMFNDAISMIHEIQIATFGRDYKRILSLCKELEEHFSVA